MRAFAMTGIDDRLHDPLDQLGRAHPRHAALRADLGRDALQRHHGAGAGLLGDLRLLRRDDVHDDAALEHLGQALLDGKCGFLHAETSRPLPGATVIVVNPPGPRRPASGC